MTQYGETLEETLTALDQQTGEDEEELSTLQEREPEGREGEEEESGATGGPIGYPPGQSEGTEPKRPSYSPPPTFPHCPTFICRTAIIQGLVKRTGRT